MCKSFKVVIVLALSYLLVASSFAQHVGANFSYALVDKEPNHLHGYQLMFNYDPDKFKWRKFNVYFDAGISHFGVSDYHQHRNINIYSIAPVVRYTFKPRGPFLPYLEFSIGLSYLSQTRLANRNLGMHFAFQDRMGIGTLLGASKQLSIGMHAVHYSNAHLANHNGGITIPLVLDIGYQFN